MSFHVQLVSTTYDLFKSQQSTDVTFICKDGQIGAHSVVLLAHSEWFKNNSDRSVIGLMEYTKQSALEFLTLLYTGIGNFEQNSPVKELLTAFRCTYHLNKEISNEDNNESLNETKIDVEDTELKVEIEDTKLKVKIEDPTVASGSGPLLNLLPNPFAQNTSVRLRKKKSSKSPKKRQPTSDEGEPLAKKRKSNTRIEPRFKQRVFVENSTTDEENEESKRLKKVQNLVLFEVKGSLTNNKGLIATVMSFKDVEEAYRQMANFCFVCLDYVPFMKKGNKSHYRAHQVNRFGTMHQCPNCLKYIRAKALYKMHTTLCATV